MTVTVEGRGVVGMTAGESDVTDSMLIVPPLKYGDNEDQRTHMLYTVGTAPRALMVSVTDVAEFHMTASEVTAPPPGETHEDATTKDNRSLLTPFGMRAPWTRTV